MLLYCKYYKINIRVVKKLKKLIKNPLITFIIGAVLFTGIASATTYLLMAESVEFNPKDDNWNVNDVDIALNDLYDKYIDITTPSVERIHVCSGENTNTCSGSTLEIGEYYICVTNSRNYNGTHTITGAEVLLNQENGGYLDYKYTTYRSFIKPTSSTITISISNGRGISYDCYHINNGD